MKKSDSEHAGHGLQCSAGPEHLGQRAKRSPQHGMMGTFVTFCRCTFRFLEEACLGFASCACVGSPPFLSFFFSLQVIRVDPTRLEVLTDFFFRVERLS